MSVEIVRAPVQNVSGGVISQRDDGSVAGTERTRGGQNGTHFLARISSEEPNAPTHCSTVVVASRRLLWVLDYRCDYKDTTKYCMLFVQRFSIPKDEKVQQTFDQSKKETEYGSNDGNASEETATLRFLFRHNNTTMDVAALATSVSRSSWCGELG